MSWSSAVDGFRVVGNLCDLSREQRRLLLDRSGSSDPSVREVTRCIIERVRCGGDEALIALAAELDGVELDALEVSRDECEAALAGLPRKRLSAASAAH